MVDLEDDRGCEAEKPKKPEKSPEELAAIALLDRLRSGDGDVKPVGLPLACVVKIVDSFDVPKANERYAMVTVEGRGGRTWRMCVFRGYLEPGMRALFVSEGAALPMDDARFDRFEVCKLRERVYRFGFGVKERRRIPSVRRGIYHINCGVLYPLDDFHELLDAHVGDVCTEILHIDSAEDLHLRTLSPAARKQVFQPPRPPQPSRPKGFLARLKRQRDRSRITND